MELDSLDQDLLQLIDPKSVFITLTYQGFLSILRDAGIAQCLDCVWVEWDIDVIVKYFWEEA